MTKKRIAIAAVAALSICAGAYGIASANFGHHGHGGPGGGVLFLLARAGGITHQQIWTALQATTIKADITQLKTDQAALYQCIATSNNCSASAYLADKAKVEADKTNAIVGLLNGVQSRTNISNVYNQLQTVKQAQQTLKGMLPHPQWGPQSQGTNGDTPSTPE